jgi:hypothetical protein
MIGNSVVQKALLTTLLAASLAGTGVARSEESAAPEKARPVTAAELYVMYAGKTWQWGEGGGYFGVEGREFRARTVGADGVTTANGRWRITDSGRLCFKATWVNSTGKYPGNTCFDHVELGGAIYQRKLPAGEWYVFKHANTKPEDEYSKLVRKDLVSSSAGGV